PLHGMLGAPLCAVGFGISSGAFVEAHGPGCGRCLRCTVGITPFDGIDAFVDKAAKLCRPLTCFPQADNVYRAQAHLTSAAMGARQETEKPTAIGVSGRARGDLQPQAAAVAIHARLVALEVCLRQTMKDRHFSPSLLPTFGG